MMTNPFGNGIIRSWFVAVLHRTLPLVKVWLVSPGQQLERLS